MDSPRRTGSSRSVRQLSIPSGAADGFGGGLASPTLLQRVASMEPPTPPSQGSESNRYLPVLPRALIGPPGLSSPPSFASLTADTSTPPMTPVVGVAAAAPATTAATTAAAAEAMTRSGTAVKSAVQLSVDVLSSTLAQAQLVLHKLDAHAADIRASAATAESNVEAQRAAILRHFDMLRREICDALDARQLELLDQLDDANKNVAVKLVEREAAVRRVAKTIQTACAQAEPLLVRADSGVISESKTAAARLNANFDTVDVTERVPHATFEAGNDTMCNILEAISREGTVVGFDPPIAGPASPTIYVPPDEHDIDLTLPSHQVATPPIAAATAGLRGFQWKHNGKYRAWLHGVAVKLVLPTACTGFCTVMYPNGDKVRGSTFDALPSSPSRSARTWFESSFDRQEILPWCYVLVHIRGPGVQWIGGDGGAEFRSFRKVLIDSVSIFQPEVRSISVKRGMTISPSDMSSDPFSLSLRLRVSFQAV